MHLRVVSATVLKLPAILSLSFTKTASNVRKFDANNEAKETFETLCWFIFLCHDIRTKPGHNKINLHNVSKVSASQCDRRILRKNTRLHHCLRAFPIFSCDINSNGENLLLLIFNTGVAIVLSKLKHNYTCNSEFRENNASVTDVVLYQSLFVFKAKVSLSVLKHFLRWRMVDR